MKYFILVLFQFFSYGEIEQNSLSKNQISEQHTLETFSEELPKEDNSYSNQKGSSQWSVKGELLASYPITIERISPVISISLEFQTPIGMENKLNWLIQAGGGVTVFYLSLDTGLRYDFQLLTLSLTLGGVIYYSFLEEIINGSEGLYLYPAALDTIKWTFSIGRRFSNEIHIALTAGAFSTIFVPFLGASISVPLKL